MLILRCLNLKITYDCTNKCSFCFSMYMKNKNIPLDELKNAVVKGRKNGCNELVLSGGEPTLYPNYITELIDLGKSLGYKKYIIQTNGYGLSQYDDLIAYIGNVAEDDDICISFSVHSHIASIHDDVSGNKGAFNNLSDAMNKIIKTNCKIYTNTVVNARNIDDLKDISAYLKKFNVSIMQFSIMHLKEENELSVSFTDAVKAIRELGCIVDNDILKTEGIPYCLLHGMEKCVGESAWPNSLDIYNETDNYLHDFKQLDYGMRKKMTSCDKCIMDKICMGVWKETYGEFSAMKIHPIM